MSTTSNSKNPKLIARGRVAALSRSRKATDPDLIEARRELNAARLAEHVENTLKDFPPLSQAQLDTIAVLLRGEIPPKEPRKVDLEAQRIAREKAEAKKAAEDFAISLTECDACNIPLERHKFAARNSPVGFHDWEPGRAERIMASKANDKRAGTSS